MAQFAPGRRRAANLLNLGIPGPGPSVQSPTGQVEAKRGRWKGFLQQIGDDAEGPSDRHDTAP
jgi:hypothetical protein